MDREDAVLIVAFLIILGFYWGLPRENIYNALVTVFAAIIAAGWFVRKRRRRD